MHTYLRTYLRNPKTTMCMHTYAYIFTRFEDHHVYVHKYTYLYQHAHNTFRSRDWLTTTRGTRRTPTGSSRRDSSNSWARLQHTLLLGCQIMSACVYTRLSMRVCCVEMLSIFKRFCKFVCACKLARCALAFTNDTWMHFYIVCIRIYPHTHNIHA
jgi:hypothetical protein